MSTEQEQLANQKPATVGRIVHFYPGSRAEGTGNEYKLPNGMDFAPAIITQVCSADHINLTVFVMARSDQGIPNPVMNAWSIKNKFPLSEGELDNSPYWVYPPMV